MANQNHKILSKELINEEHTYTFALKTSTSEPIYKKIHEVIERNFPIILVKYIHENTRCELSDSYDEDDENYNYDEYEYDVTDYKIIEDFMETKCSNWDNDYEDLAYVSEPIAESLTNSIIYEVDSFVHEVFKNIKPEDCKLTLHTEKKFAAQIQYKKRVGQENRYERSTKVIPDIIATIGGKEYTKYLGVELSKIVNLTHSSVCDYIREIERESFIDFYNIGCKDLNFPSPFKEIKYENTDVENFLYRTLYNSVKERNCLDNTLENVPFLDRDLDSYTNGSLIEKNNYTVSFKDFSTNNVFKNTCRAKILNNIGNLDSCSKYIELIVAIYSHELYIYSKVNDLVKFSVEYLGNIFQYNETKGLLLRLNVIDIIKNYYETIRIKNAIRGVLPTLPKEYYPLARKLNRKFVLHIGPTNTGKTYESLERLKNVKCGVYLAPLRLLALEVHEKLCSQGVKCSLLTGEEELRIDDETHVSSTVEKLNFNKRYDVAVIDEAQMLEDLNRGNSWSAAIMGVCADEVHVCMAPYAKDMVIKLINYCNDQYEVVEHTRDTELVYSNEKYNFIEDIQKGDALVVFSKRKVLNVAAKIKKETSLNPSVLYGALPYASRRKQFEAFLNGEAEVLVTTDAIGLGINLPIRRIIFLEDSKYDGVSNRTLTKNEVRQIAGRAGRRGIYDEGFVIGSKPIALGMEGVIESINRLYIGPSPEILKIEGDLKDILLAWELIDFPKPFVKTSLEEQYDIINKLDSHNICLRKQDLFKAIYLPYDSKSSYLNGLLISYCAYISNNIAEVPFPNKPALEYDNELNQLEDYYKGIDFYYSFCKTFNLKLNVEKVIKEREETTSKINNTLIKKSLKQISKCSQCGTELAWDHIGYKCDDCYNRGRYRGYGGYNRYYSNYDYDEEEWDDDF